MNFKLQQSGEQKLGKIDNCEFQFKLEKNFNLLNIFGSGNLRHLKRGFKFLNFILIASPSKFKGVNIFNAKIFSVLEQNFKLLNFNHVKFEKSSNFRTKI